VVAERGDLGGALQVALDGGELALFAAGFGA
jgi:hypothetical protein